MEALVIAILLCVAAIPVGLGARGAAAPAWILALAAVAGFVALARPGGPPRTDLRPQDASRTAESPFASSRACRACHPGEHASWARSYHRRMTQPASADAVLAPFDGRTLTFQGRRYRVFTEGGRFFVDMPALGTPGALPEERWVAPVVMTTGSHFLQAYWIPVEARPAPEVRAGQALFDARCARCHGEHVPGASAPLLVGARLLPEELAGRLDDGHAGGGAAFEEKERRALLAFLSRVQFDGRLLQFPWVFAVQQGVWLHEEDSFLQPPPATEREERPGDRWGFNCDECHSVGPRFAWSDARLEADSEAAELGIACEACHGPARAHAGRHRSPVARYAARLDEAPADDVVNPARLDHRRASHVCAQCHADVLRSGPGYLGYRPGEDLERVTKVVRWQDGPPYPAWLESALDDDPGRLTDTFWRDGTIRVAGRDFNGLIESACYQRGTLSCLSCHSLHQGSRDDQLGEGMRGDDACLQCHTELGTDVEAHTHHAPGSSGSRCYNCHMPHTTYGLMKAIRAHRIDSPSARVSVESGRPNACNLCHLDKTLAEVGQQLHEWYGQPLVVVPEPHGSTAASLVWLLQGDAVQRAVAAWHLGWQPARAASGEGWQDPFLAFALEDPYVAVRFVAWDALRRRGGLAELTFDFTGTTEPFRVARERALAALADQRLPTKRALLVGQDGEILLQDLDALRARRDETIVRVAE